VHSLSIVVDRWHTLTFYFVGGIDDRTGLIAKNRRKRAMELEMHRRPTALDYAFNTRSEGIEG